MTKLSVNINKIALLRNSRGRNFPDVQEFSERVLNLGADGITLHPRQDQRHARYKDVEELQAICRERNAELNVEGYPSADFLKVVKRARPTQCTLVPDAPNQLTSDHGWDAKKDAILLKSAITELKDLGIRVSLFIDHDYLDVDAIHDTGTDRIELYTEAYAEHYATPHGDILFNKFHEAARRAEAIGLGVNAGHDLNLQNLPRFLSIPNILEISIGHALIVESIELGIEKVMGRYLDILQSKSNQD